jgi:hypothetical protein
LSGETASSFAAVTQLCSGVDRFLAERAKITSPLLKVPLFERSQEWTDQLQAAQKQISQRQEEIMAVLKEMNAAWASAPAVGSRQRAESLPLPRLEEVYRSMSYLTRWRAQLQERVLQLAL